MDSIKQAVELARAAEGAPAPRCSASTRHSRRLRGSPRCRQSEMCYFNTAHLEGLGIVAHGASGHHGHYYEMLRTQVLQEMDKKSWQFLAVTSPTAGCGKTVTACNLAMSIARLPERSVLLVDLDLRKPMVANYLGVEGSGGVLSVLEGRATFRRRFCGQALARTVFGASWIGSASGSSEWMASQTMGTFLQSIKRDFRSCIVIFDLPPMLLGDDVISILPRMDAALLVAGVGSTSVSDIRECQKHLQRHARCPGRRQQGHGDGESYYGYY